MLNIQKYLLTNSLESLKKKFAITSRRHGSFQNLVQLKYSQLDSKMSETIVQECRGIILDEEENWRIVSYPFDKFFNYGETNAAQVDWHSARVFEKIDGSLMTLYFYDNNWNVASSGMPDASGKIHGQLYDMRELFWKIWNEKNYVIPEDTSLCYMFEMVHPSIEILVPQTEGNILFLGARDLKSLEEKNIDEVGHKSWSRPKTFNFDSHDTTFDACCQLNPMKQEGYVVVDTAFNRVKIKSPQYVKISLLKGADHKLTDRYLINIIQINEGEEFLSYFEEYRERYTELKLKFNNLREDLEKTLIEVKLIANKRTLGLKVKDSAFPSLFFQLKEGKVKSVSEYLRKVSAKNILQKI